MWKEHLYNIENIEYYAIIGFLIFFIFFILIAVHTFRLDKERTKVFGNLPLDDDKQDQVEQQNLTL